MKEIDNKLYFQENNLNFKEIVELKNNYEILKHHLLKINSKNIFGSEFVHITCAIGNGKCMFSLKYKKK